MSDDHRVNHPGRTAPSWVTMPTTPWARTVPRPRARGSRHGKPSGLPSGRRPGLTPLTARPAMPILRTSPPPTSTRRPTGVPIATSTGLRRPRAPGSGQIRPSPGTAAPDPEEPAHAGIRPVPIRDPPGPHGHWPRQRMEPAHRAEQMRRDIEAPRRVQNTAWPRPATSPESSWANRRAALRGPDHRSPPPWSGRGVSGPYRSSGSAPIPPPRPHHPDRPVSGIPVSGVPVSAIPVSGIPISGIPISGIPISGIPISGIPISGIPVSGIPVTAPPFPVRAAHSPDEAPGPDGEKLLAGYCWRFDPETLREVIDEDETVELRTVRDLLTRKLNSVTGNAARARLLSLRAVVSRILGDLHKALADGKLALAHAEATGELRRIAIAQARLAHVHQWREEYDEADRLFALANSTELPDRLRATMHQHAGKCAYDQDRYIEACNHFELALELRRDEDPDLIAQMNLALDAVFRRVGDKGWGPYPRTKEQILQIRKPPTPVFDPTAQRWGYTEENGAYALRPIYLDAQPFRDAVAWVQRAGSDNWELIDETGEPLIDSSSGYLGVSSFSDGLAWVSVDGSARWIAIDKTNTVLISTGFEDVRPFRRGLAAVRRDGRWGAVDGAGRVVVPFRFDGFATAMHDGRYIDGFSDEGLAVVSFRGRKGVVDRSGRVLVNPEYPMLVIHPVAFLFRDDQQQWGALDRRGEPLIDPAFSSRIDVVEEIDRLLADTRPML